MDNRNLRRPIDDQLDKVESTHSFAHTVLDEHNGLPPDTGKKEQR
jgi:hypothetical protein